jgi:hypothetical protein
LIVEVMLNGDAAPLMTGLLFDWAEVEPIAFAAVTATLSVAPASAAASGA